MQLFAIVLAESANRSCLIGAMSVPLTEQTKNNATIAGVLAVWDSLRKPDFVAFVQHLLEQVYAKAYRVHLVMDNLNTHFFKSFEEVLGVKAAKKLLRRAVFHYTPKHASWLNMAEIEIGVLDRQCLNRRLPDRDAIVAEVDAWQQRRNDDQRRIEWSFTRQDADRKLAQHYVS